MINRNVTDLPAPLRKVDGNPYLTRGDREALIEAAANYDRAIEALRELIEDAEDMRGYVDDYFAEKWGHDEALARARATLTALNEREGER